MTAFSQHPPGHIKPPLTEPGRAPAPGPGSAGDVAEEKPPARPNETADDNPRSSPNLADPDRDPKNTGDPEPLVDEP